LANRQVVEVRFDPFFAANPLIAPIHVPQFLLIYAMLIAGIVLGGIASWFAQGKQRREKRHWRRKARELEEAQKTPAAAHPDLTLIEGP